MGHVGKVKPIQLSAKSHERDQSDILVGLTVAPGAHAAVVISQTFPPVALQRFSLPSQRPHRPYTFPSSCARWNSDIVRIWFYRFQRWRRFDSCSCNQPPLPAPASEIREWWFPPPVSNSARWRDIHSL